MSTKDGKGNADNGIHAGNADGMGNAGEYHDNEDAVCTRWLEAAPFTDKHQLPLELAKHMESCETCRLEWNEMQAVWEALAMDADEIEVPEGLKEEVMNAVFAESQREMPDGNRRPRRLSKRIRSARFAFLGKFAGLGAACLIVGAGFGLWYAQHATQPVVREAVEEQQPMQRGQEWKLVSFDPGMPEATGTAAIVQKGDARSVVVNVSGLAATKNDEAYQVWLIHDGERMNCGTFRVDGRGKGTLVYYLHEADLEVGAFGITLEPDSQGTKPRGKKVAGTAST